MDGKTDTSKVRVGNEYTLPNVSLKVEGRKFSGWEDSDGNVYMAGTDVLISADTFFTAVWTAETTTTLIGGIEYADPVAAFRSLKDGETIEILSDVESSGLMYTTENGVSPFPDEGITLDFNGNTLTCIGPAVGSSGTETNCFQLLSGNIVEFRNGEISASSPTAKMVIQNYSDRTLDDVVVNAGEATQYVASNNFGSLTMKNNTILNAENCVAFDVYYYLSSAYAEGVSVKIEDQSVVIDLVLRGIEEAVIRFILLPVE